MSGSCRMSWAKTRLLLSALLGLALAFPSYAEMELSASELYVSETFTMKLKVRVPLLPEPYSNRPSIPPNRFYIHVDAPWLDPQTPIIRLSEAEGRTARLKMDGFDTLGEFNRAYKWTLNEYIAGQDFFGRAVPATFPLEVKRETVDGKDGWTLEIRFPAFECDRPGEAIFSDTLVTIPVISSVDRFGQMRVEEKKVTLEGARLTVKDAPAEGRPGGWMNAFCREFSAEATLEPSVCTLGDPMTLSIEVKADSGLDRMTPPAFDGGDVFKIDSASLKTEKRQSSRVFTWRVRPVKAGTVEFPEIQLSYFDVSSGKYGTFATPPMPIQVKAGAQATLGEIEDGEEWPLPEGIVHASPEAPPAEDIVRRKGALLVAFALAPIMWLLVYVAPLAIVRFSRWRRAFALKRALPRAVASAMKMKRDGIDRYFSLVHSVNGASVTGDEAQRLMKDEPEDARNAVVSALRRMESGFAKGAVVLAFALLLPFASNAAGADFTWQRALALAGRADSEAGFKKAAEAFEDCLASAGESQSVYLNIGACRYFAGDYVLSREAYRKAEKWTGETEATRRGLLAAEARLKNNPRAGLGLQRSILAPWYALSVEGRLWAFAGLWWIFWLVLAAKSLFKGMRKGAAALLAVAAFALANSAFAQDASFFRISSSSRRPIKVSGALERTDVSVMEDASLIISIDTPKNCTLENISISGVPDEDDGAMPSKAEVLADIPSSNPSNVVKRLAVPLLFTRPGTHVFSPAISGMATETVEFSSGGMYSKSISSNQFGGQLGNMKVFVEPLPEEGKGDDFSGAVARNVKLKAELSAKNVHPGDLVTATYTLEWDGWLPPDASIKLESRSGDMKEYPPKEESRLQHKAVWTQVFVPGTTNATLTARASLSYYDPDKKGYMRAVAEPEPLSFVSAEAASLESGSVVVAGEGAQDAREAAPVAASRDVQVRFAPGENAMALFTMRLDAAFSIVEDRGKWVRVRCAKGAGWVKSSEIGSASGEERSDR